MIYSTSVWPDPNQEDTWRQTIFFGLSYRLQRSYATASPKLVPMPVHPEAR